MAGDLEQAVEGFSGCDEDVAAALKLASRLAELGVWDLDSGKVEAGLYVVAQAFADVRQKELDRQLSEWARTLGCECRWEDGLLIPCDAERHPWRAIQQKGLVR